MAHATHTTRFRFWLWLIALVSVMAPLQSGMGEAYQSETAISPGSHLLT
jgi:hypothetical protein